MNTAPSPWKRHKDDSKSLIFLHSCLDDYGLDVYEFRVLAHIARRQSGSKGCFAKQKNIAKTCCMSHRKAQQVLQVLFKAQILIKEAREGSTNVYRIAPVSAWKEPGELAEIRKITKSNKD